MRSLVALLTEVVSVLCAEVASVMTSGVSGDNGTETFSGRVHWSVNQGQLSDVVLIDHSKDWLLLAHMDLRVLNFLLVGGLEFPL